MSQTQTCETDTSGRDGRRADGNNMLSANWRTINFSGSDNSDVCKNIEEVKPDEDQCWVSLTMSISGWMKDGRIQIHEFIITGTNTFVDAKEIPHERRTPSPMYVVGCAFPG
jgi:hypothetical protein